MKSKKAIIITLIITWVLLIAAAVTLVVVVQKKSNNKKSVNENVSVEVTQTPEATIEPEPTIEPQATPPPLPGTVCDKVTITNEADIAKALEYDSIEYLKIDSANISDFSFLSELNISMLQVLNNNNHPLDLNYINSEYIRQVFFHEVELENKDAISTFKYLSTFILKANSITGALDNLDFLAPCTNLTEIEIYNSKITNLDFAKNLKRLNTLSITNSAIEDISTLSNCSNLKWLTLETAKISDISPLKDLSLCEVNLNDNYISDVSPLKKSLGDQLGSLSLKQNFISDISALNTSTLLYMVDLSENYITDFPEQLANNGATIDLDSNNISSLSAEEIETITNSNAQFFMFDNLLDESTMNKIAYIDSVSFMTSADVLLTPENAIAYNNKLKDILSICNKGSEKEKVFRIAYYIKKNCVCDYTYVDPYKDDAYGALFSKAVCGGFTDLTNSLCRHLGIKVKSYHGDLSDYYDEVRHVWSVVCIDGIYYHCDALTSMASPDSYPHLALVSDSKLEFHEFFLDAPNFSTMNESISDAERNKIINNLKADEHLFEQ